MAEANGNRTHPGPSRPYAGFEDQGHHQAPVTSASGSFRALLSTIVAVGPSNSNRANLAHRHAVMPPVAVRSDTIRRFMKVDSSQSPVVSVRFPASYWQLPTANFLMLLRAHYKQASQLLDEGLYLALDLLVEHHRRRTGEADTHPGGFVDLRLSKTLTPGVLQVHLQARLAA
jgi:hypothetical protein